MVGKTTGSMRLAMLLQPECDLATTGYSRHSRTQPARRREDRGGKTLAQILAEMQMAAEGVWTTRALFGPESEARGIPMPIAEQVQWSWTLLAAERVSAS